jgi:hypothetical protein
MQASSSACGAVSPAMIVSPLIGNLATGRRVPTGRIVISGLSTSTERFVC